MTRSGGTARLGLALRAALVACLLGLHLPLVGADPSSGPPPRWPLEVYVVAEDIEFLGRAVDYANTLWRVLEEGGLPVEAPSVYKEEIPGEADAQAIRCTIQVRVTAVSRKDVAVWSIRLERLERVRTVADGRELYAATASATGANAVAADHFAPLKVREALVELARSFPGGGVPSSPSGDGPASEPDVPIPPGWRRTRFGGVPPQRTYRHPFRIDQLYQGLKRELWHRVGGGPKAIGDELSVSFMDATVPTTSPPALRRLWLGADASPMPEVMRPVVKIAPGDEGVPEELTLMFGAISDDGGLISPSKSNPRAPTSVRFVVDGQRIKIPTRDRRTHYYVGDLLKGPGQEEQLCVIVPLRDFLRIVAGSEVRVEVGKVRATFGAEHRELYRDFASKLLWNPGDTGGGAATGVRSR